MKAILRWKIVEEIRAHSSIDNIGAVITGFVIWTALLMLFSNLHYLSEFSLYTRITWMGISLTASIWITFKFWRKGS